MVDDVGVLEDRLAVDESNVRDEQGFNHPLEDVLRQETLVARRFCIRRVRGRDAIDRVATYLVDDLIAESVCEQVLPRMRVVP